MRQKKIGFITLFLLIIFSTSRTLADVCPIFPYKAQVVDNLEWGIKGQTIRISLGQSSENPYLKSGLEWNMISGQLDAITKTGTVEALQFAEQAKISDKFLGLYDETHLELSPSFTYGLYTQTQPAPYALYSFNTESEKTVELGLVSNRLSKIQYSWYRDDEAVLTITPIYGEGYQVIDVCLDGSCFVNLSQLINQLIERPAILSAQGILAVYSTYNNTSRIWLYDLNTKKIASEFTVNVRLLPQLNPIWSEDGKSLYMVGFNEDKSTEYVYQFDLGSQKLTVITDLGNTFVKDWLIEPSKNLIALSIPEIVFKCYT